MTFQAEIELKQRLRRMHGKQIRKKTYEEIKQARDRMENKRQAQNRLRELQKPFKIRETQQRTL